MLNLILPWPMLEGGTLQVVQGYREYAAEKTREQAPRSMAGQAVKASVVICPPSLSRYEERGGRFGILKDARVGLEGVADVIGVPVDKWAMTAEVDVSRRYGWIEVSIEAA